MPKQQGKKNKPGSELLLPVGRTESFYAALESGADALYMGLRELNARGRASNFLPWQVSAMIKEARQKGVKVYLTLNTVVKNSELVKLASIIHILHQLKPDAVIVQDWGVFYLIRKFLPSQPVHSSTQMAIHNSVGVNHAHRLGIKRVVLARELTQKEIQKISKKSKAELEVFIHGALCYSFSGMCLFSSYLGGSGANRGYCLQPCRRNYSQNHKNEYFFNLKDNQLIDQLPQLQKMGIASLKVEGRLKPASYVYQTGKAYRMAIGNPDKAEEAKRMLEWDMGREKTSYFFGGNVNNAINFKANTGKALGDVISNEGGFVQFTSNEKIENGYRLRFKDHGSDQQVTHKAKSVEFIDENTYKIAINDDTIKVGDEVFVTSLPLDFPSKIQSKGDRINERAPQKLISSILNHVKIKGSPQKTEFYIRIDSIAWLRKIRVESFDGIIINLDKSELVKLDVKLPFIQKHIKRFHIELPKFISEENLEFYKKILHKLHKEGIDSFFISHLSQIDLLPDSAKISANENVYAYNDAAIKMLKSHQLHRYTYPLENDMFNLIKGSDRSGIQPMYFHPHLFYSRMPVDVQSEKDFGDKKGTQFQKVVRDGVTIVIPEIPVSLTQYFGQLKSKGFNRFLIDMSFSKPSKNSWQTILRRMKNSEQIQPSTNFNFKKDLK